MKEYLPIGSVVILKGGVKPLMIFGRRQILKASNEEYDYMACFYPEGNLGPDNFYLFNEDKIEKVLFVGYKTEEETKYVEKLNNIKL